MSDGSTRHVLHSPCGRFVAIQLSHPCHRTRPPWGLSVAASDASSCTLLMHALRRPVRCWSTPLFTLKYSSMFELHCSRGCVSRAQTASMQRVVTSGRSGCGGVGAHSSPCCSSPKRLNVGHGDGEQMCVAKEDASISSTDFALLMHSGRAVDAGMRSATSSATLRTAPLHQRDSICTQRRSDSGG